jgi:imidazolonepropionase-like amidohydrolase
MCSRLLIWLEISTQSAFRKGENNRMNQARAVLLLAFRAYSAWNTSTEVGLQPKAGKETSRSGAAGAFLKRATYPTAVVVTAALCVITSVGQQSGPAGVHGQLSRGTVNAFVGVTVIPMDSERVLADQVVLVQDDRILELGPSNALRVPPEANRIEGHGLFLFPGLADMHVHLMENETYFPLFLANGVTTVRNMAGGPEMSALRDRVKSGAPIGPTIYTAGPILDGFPPVWEGSDVVTTPEQARRTVEKQKSAGYDFLKIYDNLLPAAYDAIIRAATQAHMPVVGHVPPHVGLQAVLDAHQWSIEHLTGYFEWLQVDRSPFRQANDHETFPHPAHLLAKRQALVDWVDESRIPQVAAATVKAGTWNVPTLVAWRNMTPHTELDTAWKRPNMDYATPMLREWWNSDNGYTAEDWAAKRRGDAVRAKLVKALHDAGARLVVGTDTPHPFVMPGFSVHEELANFVSAGMPPYEALKTATVDAAEFMGAQGEFGVIKRGARADLILLDGNPLEDVTNTSRIAGVMAHGHWLSREALHADLPKGTQVRFER